MTIESGQMLMHYPILSNNGVSGIPGAIQSERPVTCVSGFGQHGRRESNPRPCRQATLRTLSKAVVPEPGIEPG